MMSVRSPPSSALTRVWNVLDLELVEDFHVATGGVGEDRGDEVLGEIVGAGGDQGLLEFVKAGICFS